MTGTFLATSNMYTPGGSASGRPVQYTYVQNTASAAGTLIAVNRSLFKFDTTSMNVSDNLLVADSGSAAVMKLPLTGIWNITWNACFASQGVAPEYNCLWFQITSKSYDPARRECIQGTVSTYHSISFTGYLEAGDLMSLNAYSPASNTLQAGLGFLSANLVLPTAPRPPISASFSVTTS